MMLFARKKSKNRTLYKTPKPLTAFDKVEAVVSDKEGSSVTRTSATKTATGNTSVNASHNTSISPGKGKNDCNANSNNSNICRSSCNSFASAKVSASSYGIKKDSSAHNHVHTNVSERNEKNTHNKAVFAEEKTSTQQNVGKSSKEIHEGKHLKATTSAIAAEKTSTAPRNVHDTATPNKNEKFNTHGGHTLNLQSTCSPSTVGQKSDNLLHKRKKNAAKNENMTLSAASAKAIDVNVKEKRLDGVERVKDHCTMEADNESPGNEWKEDSNVSDETEGLHDNHKESVLSNTLNNSISRTMPTEDSELSNSNINTNTTINANSEPKAKKTKKKKIIIRKKKTKKTQEPKKEEQKLSEKELEENVNTSNDKKELDEVENTPRPRREQRAPSMEALSLLANRKINDEVNNTSLTSDPARAQRANKLET